MTRARFPGFVRATLSRPESKRRTMTGKLARTAWESRNINDKPLVRRGGLAGASQVSDEPRAGVALTTRLRAVSWLLARIGRTKEGNERNAAAAVALADVDCFNHIIAQPGAVKKRSVHTARGGEGPGERDGRRSPTRRRKTAEHESGRERASEREKEEKSRGSEGKRKEALECRARVMRSRDDGDTTAPGPARS